ncbi:carbonic anhydrase [Microbaculum marinum]|uniref:Carbonic anhydrase n=1 Tax=Microbaculum marinum TaxID=1764581 RepID=A0AAW9RMR0_9HYPH
MTTSFPPDLIDGYRRYSGERLPEERRRLAQLARLGQAPRAMVIGCCDSRAAPETVFSTGPGELFVVRNVANIVPPYAPDEFHHSTSAAIEFAVRDLLVPDIIVLGHSLCGGIAAYLKGRENEEIRGEFIGPWIDLLRGSRAEAEQIDSAMASEDMQRAVEEVVVRRSLANLLTFPFLKARVDAGSLALHGAHFGIATGELRVMNPKTGTFEKVSEQAG